MSIARVAGRGLEGFAMGPPDELWLKAVPSPRSGSMSFRVIEEDLDSKIVIPLGVLAAIADFPFIIVCSDQNVERNKDP